MFKPTLGVVHEGVDEFVPIGAAFMFVFLSDWNCQHESYSTRCNGALSKTARTPSDKSDWGTFSHMQATHAMKTTVWKSTPQIASPVEIGDPCAKPTLLNFQQGRPRRKRGTDAV